MLILKNIFFAALLIGMQLFLLPSANAQADAGAFIGGATDLPLMDGLEEVEGARVVFDKSSGRIIETRLQGRVSAADVSAFYVAALRQLGWVPGDGQPSQLVFVREQERLVMDIITISDGVEIGVLLEPGT